MNDLTVRFENASFSLRTGCIILHNNCILAATNINDKAFYTIGGRTHLNESTEEAALREAFEETGRKFEIDRHLFTHEWFFEVNGKKHHHIEFYYLMKGDASSIKDGSPSDLKGFETIHWLPLDKLHEINLVPSFLKKALLNLPERPKHIISKE